MDGQVKEIHLFREWGKDPIQRTERILFGLEGFPALTIDIGIGMVDPDAELVINVAF